MYQRTESQVNFKTIVKVVLTGIATVTLLILFSCSNTIIPAGSVGIIIHQTGSNRGVQDYPTRTGRVWYSPVNDDVIEFPTYATTVSWTHDAGEGNPTNEEIVFTNKDQMTIAVDVSLTYALDANKVPAFYVKFHESDMKKFTDGFMRSAARDCFNDDGGNYSIQQIMGDNARFLTEVHNCLQGRVEKYGVEIMQFGLIGAPRPPVDVIRAINAAATAQRLAIQKQNELAQTQADVAKQVAQSEGNAQSHIKEAEGIAKANQIVAASITNPILEKQKLDNQAAWIHKWDGAQPHILTGSGSGLMLNIGGQ